MTVDKTVSKEEITKANGVQGIFRVQPVRIIPPLKDKMRDEEYQGEKQNSNQSFDKILRKVCSHQEENVTYETGTYNQEARENFYAYGFNRNFDKKG